MCFAGPVRVLLLQSTEQVQGLWSLLLQLRHWFQEGSRAEEFLQLSVGIKEGEGKILASLGVRTTKTNFNTRDLVQPTAAAVRAIPNVTSSALLAQPMWSVRASPRDPDTHPVPLSPAWAFSVFLFLYFSPLCTVKENFTGLCLFYNLTRIYSARKTIPFERELEKHCKKTPNLCLCISKNPEESHSLDGEDLL